MRAAQPAASLRTCTLIAFLRVGDEYRLEGYVAYYQGSERIYKSIKGYGHFNGKIVPGYHNQAGSSSEDSRTEFIEKDRT